MNEIQFESPLFKKISKAHIKHIYLEFYLYLYKRKGTTIEKASSCHQHLLTCIRSIKHLLAL